MLTMKSSLWLSAILFCLIGDSTVPARAQGNCLPVSGTVYGALYGEDEESVAWHALGNFTIGDQTYYATVAVQGVSMNADEDIWQGGELWTFDFGGGDTVQLMTSYVTEHMTNPDGIFHIREVGTFINGAGMFKNAYGNLCAEGPFGPNVVLYDITELPADAMMYFVAPAQGLICGVNNRNRQH